MNYAEIIRDAKKEGIREGREEGIKEGREYGIKKGKVEIIKVLLKTKSIEEVIALGFDEELVKKAAEKQDD